MQKNLIIRLEEGLLILLLLVMTLLVFAEVIARFVFNTGIHWAQEATLLMTAWFVLLGASYGIKVGAHIGINIFVQSLPSKTARLVNLVAVGLCLLYCGLFLYGGWSYVTRIKKIGIELQDIAIGKWIATSILIIAFILLIARFLELGWKIYTGKANGFDFADEGKESMELSHDLRANLKDVKPTTKKVAQENN